MQGDILNTNIQDENVWYLWKDSKIHGLDKLELLESLDVKQDNILISREEEWHIIDNVRKKNDIVSQRIIRYYDMPDLSRTDWSPIKAIVDKIKWITMFKKFDTIETPEIVWTYETFDLFNFTPNHPARSKSDTYYVTEDKILRTHTTVMWYYYFNHPWIKEKLEKNWEIGVLSYWKVYRKDDIDSRHYPVFHQIDWLYICSKDTKSIWKEDLVRVLLQMWKSIFGDDIKYKMNEDRFPYTDPSIDMEIEFWEKRLEILWAWVVLPTVLDNIWIDSKKYQWWAFGPWIERLAMIKMGIPDIRILWSNDPKITKQLTNLDNKFQEISKYPHTYRDISFVVSKDMSLNNYYEIVWDEWRDLIEQVELIDKYENDKKFGPNNISYTFRITYRSNERTLLNEEINGIQTRIREKTEKILWSTLR